MNKRLTHLKKLEAEAIFIFREVVSEFQNPAMLYSIGKDSSVLLHLAIKAFAPAKIPFPIMHVDTQWKFKEMTAFRDKRAKELGLDMIVYTNKKGLKRNISPFTHGKLHTDVMKTQALKQALDKYRFDAVFGGARRDEEKSRAKERIYSFRDKNHRWNPKKQRPELWDLYNPHLNKEQSMRIFPLSNWTEFDIWQYIHTENIPIVSLYFAKKRNFVIRDGMKILIDDDRLKLNAGEKVFSESIRFRTLGCYPLTGAINSNATNLLEIIEEILLAKQSERQGRAIDKDSIGSMERKKIEGYF